MRPAILTRLRGVQPAGKGWLAFCPAHDDQHKRSLSVGVGDDGRTLLHCHAKHCPPEAIARAVDMTMAELGPPADPESPSGRAADRRIERRIVATYDYVDARGALLYQVVRMEPKDFRCRRPHRGGWAWGLAKGWYRRRGDDWYQLRGEDAPHSEDEPLPAVAHVLYRLSELAEARRAYTAEGERDCNTLAGLGLTATTNHGGAGKWRAEHTAALVAAAVPEVIVLGDNDRPGEAHAEQVARACAAAGLLVKRVRLPDLPPLRDKHGEDITDWLALGHTIAELEALADVAPDVTTSEAEVAGAAPTEDLDPELRREGLDLVLGWPDGVRLLLAAIRDSREGVRGELTVTRETRRCWWASWLLASTAAREMLRKVLDAKEPGVPWGEYLAEAAWRFTDAARRGEPLVTLTGTPTSPTRELLPRLLYEGEPTSLIADGDTGKSLVALALAAAVQSGTALPFGLKPARAVPAAYLDWETSRDTLEGRLARLATGLGIDPPAILYKRMTRPLVDEAGALAAEFVRRGIGFVVVDSKMFAVASGDGAPFHEPITAFYNALRLFAPAATLVLNHITNADARAGGPARPFGGAFAFNGPRLIWEAKRDRDITDATALAFTCTKANNLPRLPEPFGLRFVPSDNAITVSPFDLTEAAPQVVISATLPYRIRLALAREDLTAAELAKRLTVKEDTVSRSLRRLREKGQVAEVDDTKPYRWRLAGGLPS